IGIIFAIVIAGILFFGLCAAIIYFGFVKRMRKSEKQRHTGNGTISRTTSILRAPTSTYTTLRNEKPPFPHQQLRSAYIPSLETPILQSPMHTQPAYVPPPPIYAVQSDYPQSQKQRRNYPNPENYPTWKGATTGSQKNIISDKYPFSFHTSSV
ncbi:unnamed protein product, partial [Cercopithifilaria johnstoni]